MLRSILKRNAAPPPAPAPQPTLESLAADLACAIVRNGPDVVVRRLNGEPLAPDELQAVDPVLRLLGGVTGSITTASAPASAFETRAAASGQLASTSPAEGHRALAAAARSPWEIRVQPLSTEEIQDLPVDRPSSNREQYNLVVARAGRSLGLSDQEVQILLETLRTGEGIQAIPAAVFSELGVRMIQVARGGKLPDDEVQRWMGFREVRPGKLAEKGPVLASFAELISTQMGQVALGVEAGDAGFALKALGAFAQAMELDEEN